MASTNEKFKRRASAIRPTITYTIAGNIECDISNCGQGVPACAGSASTSIRRQTRAIGMTGGEFQCVHRTAFGCFLVQICRFLQFTGPAISRIMGG